MRRRLKRQKLVSTYSAQDAVQTVLSQFPKGISESSEDDVSVLAAICMMRVAPSGKEDPRELMRQASDKIVNRVALQFRTMNTDPIMSPIAQLFLIEWAYRRDYLNQDWRWEWNSDQEGQVRYDPRISIDQIIQATNAA